MDTTTTRTAYYGTFVHSKSLNELEISHNSVICVDEYGKIAAVERNLSSLFAVGQVLDKLGWNGDSQDKEKPMVEHVEHVELVHHDEEVRHNDEVRSDDGSMEGLEHVGNGVHVLESGINGHSGTTNGHSTNGYVKGTTNGHASKQAPEVKLVMCRNEEFFFPGFIDSHIHASQYSNAGIFSNTTLMSWLEKYTFPTEASLSSLLTARQVYNRVIARTLSHGTTTAAYFATIDVASTNLLADLCLEKGQRALVGRCCMDSLSPDYYCDESTAQSLQRTEDCIHHVRSIDPNFELVCPIITPRFAPSCSSELLQGLGNLAKETDLPIQTHVSENHGEIQLVKDLFPKSKHYTDVYDTHGLLGPKTILAHGIHLSESERDLIKARETKVAHCPNSNSTLTSGVARVRWLLDAGIDVGLGTDMAGGYSLSILEATRQAILVSRHVAMAQKCESEAERVKLSVEEVLYLATRGGAKVVGMADRVGGFEVGMEWDAQLVGLDVVSEDGEIDTKQGYGGPGGPVDVFGWESDENKIAKWVFNGDDRNTMKVWVKGRLVHERRN